MKLACMGLLIVCTVPSLFGMQINEANMQQASREFTEQELNQVREYIKMRMDQAKADDDMVQEEKLEAIFKEFSYGRYDLVIQGIKAVGDNPQKILRITGLREKMLAGELVGTPWFIREIAGLNWFFERDSKKVRKQWPLPKDKLTYLISLVDQLERNHARIIDVEMLQDAINTLLRRIQELIATVPKSLKAQGAVALERLVALRTMRGVAEPAV